MPGAASAQRGGSTRWQHGRADGREEAGNEGKGARNEGGMEGWREAGSERAGSPPGDAGTAAPGAFPAGVQGCRCLPIFDFFGFCFFVLFNAFFHFSAELRVVFIDGALHFLCSHMDLMLTFLQFFILLGFFFFGC